MCVLDLVRSLLDDPRELCFAAREDNAGEAFKRKDKAIENAASDPDLGTYVLLGFTKEFFGVLLGQSQF